MCVQRCKDDASCAAATYDYDDFGCVLWRPGTFTPGSTYAASGGIAFKTFTSVYVAASIGKEVGSSFNSNTAAAASAASHKTDTAGATPAGDAAKAASLSPGLFTYTPGASAAAAFKQGSLTAFNDASLVECLASCAYQNMCSGVVFGPYNETTGALGDISGAPAGTKCQWIMGQSRPGDSRRTLIKTRDPVGWPS
jgi:hypothetical protein